MKKKSSKNYIAFTLTEMTMVLLIMSIIAAVSAPLVKHAVSDVTNNSAETKVALWGKINNLAGIHNLNGDGGIVSIGNIPSGNAVNYNYPALMVQSNGKEYASDLGQIGFYSNWSPRNKIAMDRYNNILVGYANKYIDSHDSIELGDVGWDTIPTRGVLTYGSHIYIGHTPLTPYNNENAKVYTDNAILIGGSDVVKAKNNDNINNLVDLKGNNVEVKSSNENTYVRAYNSNIISHNNRVNVQLYGVSIGKSPYTDADYFKGVFIGAYAGRALDSSSSSSATSGSLNYENAVAIGYSSLTFNTSTYNGKSYTAKDSVAIGLQSSNLNGAGAYATYSVSIGSYAGKGHSLNKSIAIGSRASVSSWHDVDQNETISIGFYANAEGSSHNGVVSIGSYSGYDNRFKGRSALYIGNYAGYQSGATIAIGTYACKGDSGDPSGHSCIGNYRKNYNTIFSDNVMQLYSWSYGKITLAAKSLYAPAAENLVTSDVRSKRNIALAPYGIKDFRKFNIYNFALKYDKDHLKHIGVIAQEYRKAFPLAIIKGGKYLSIQPDWLYYSMINAVKDLDKLIQEFQVKLDEYVNNFESTKARIADLEQRNAKEKQNNANMRKELEQINAQLNAKK